MVNRESANEQAAGKIIQFFVWIVIVGVVSYSEVLYLGIVGVLFPSGIMYGACILGAFATGISVLCLYAGKSHWFRPGSQLITAWFFTGLEMTILILNDILAMAIHNGGVDQYLALYRFFAPAVPVIALIGWGVLLFLDPARKIRHARMEMQDEFAEQELAFEREKFAAQMEVRRKGLEYMKQHLTTAIANPESIAQIQAGAYKITNEAVTNLTGIHPLPQPKQLTVQSTIDSQAPVSQNTEPLQVLSKSKSK